MRSGLRSVRRATELRGSVIDVVRELLSAGLDEPVHPIVAKLLECNHQLELLVATMRGSKNQKEQVAGAKLAAMLEALKSQPEDQNPETLRQANAALEKIVNANCGDTEQPKPPKQAPVRWPPPPDCDASSTQLMCPSKTVPARTAARTATASCTRPPWSSTSSRAKSPCDWTSAQSLGCKVFDAELERAPMDRDSAKGIVTGALWGYVGDQDYAVYLYTVVAPRMQAFRTACSAAGLRVGGS